MILKSCSRSVGAALLTLLTVGCVHRTTGRQDPGFSGIFQQQARGAFNPLTDDPRVKAIEARVKLDPNDLAARLELAAIYENYRLYDAGLKQYAEALRVARSTPGAGEPLADQAVMGLARCALASGRLRETIPLLETFAKEAPSAGSWTQLGQLYEELEELPAGENALRKAVALDAGSDRLHNNLGYNLLLQKKTDAAETEFRRALELNPDSATAHNNLGVALALRGDLQGALEQFQITADAATAHNNLAVVLFETGQYEQSREQLIKALAIRHDFAPALSNFKLVQARIRE